MPRKYVSLKTGAHRWLKEHPEEIKAYAGHAIAVSRQGIELSDPDYDRLVKRVEKSGLNRNSLVMFIVGGFGDA